MVALYKTDSVSAYFIFGEISNPGTGAKVRSLHFIYFTQLMKWADVLCIAPLDANTLAKLFQGICDNLLL